MAFQEPFSQLTGVCKIYLAPTGESEPAVNATPAGNWVLVGNTDGEQSLQHAGALTYFRDNEHQAPRKAVRPEEDAIITFTLVDLTLENYARIVSDVSKVTSQAGPPATKKLPIKRGLHPYSYAVLFKGEALSPYGALPGHYYVPFCVVDGEPTLTWAKDGRPGLETQVHVLEDTDQAAGDEMGWLRVQTS